MPRLSAILVTLAFGVASAQPHRPAVKPPAPAAAKVRGPGEAPMIALADAIVKARAHARGIRLDLTKQYLQRASFNPVTRTWSVAWQLAMAKGGMTEIRIAEAGTIDVVYGE